MRDWKEKEEGLCDSSWIFWTTEWLVGVNRVGEY